MIDVVNTTVTQPTQFHGSRIWARAFAAVYDPLLWFGERAGVRALRRELLANARGCTRDIGSGTGLNLRHYPNDLDELVLAEPDPAMRARLRTGLSLQSHHCAADRNQRSHARRPPRTVMARNAADRATARYRTSPPGSAMTARASAATQMQRFSQMPFEPFERGSPYGTPEHVAEFLHPYIEADCSTFNVIACAADDETAMAGG